MPRGGTRPGAGGKPTWKHGRTKTIRVPIALADEIIKLARELDEEGYIESDTSSKTIDLSGVNIFETGKGETFLFLRDLLLSGYEIKPDWLASKIINEVYKSQLQQEILPS